VQQFKYGRKVSLGRPLVRLLAAGCRPYFQEASLDCIIPIPLHLKRLRRRGFNQSVILSLEVGRSWGIPVNPFILLRTRETEAQTELTEEQRRRNLRGAFAVAPKKSVRGIRVLLVDDVYTLGATVNECSRVMLRAGAR
jgi:ComF family protein